MEIWKDIPGYEGIYQASNYGQIRSTPGKITSNKRHGVRRWKSRTLKGRGDFAVTGRRVSLWKDGKAKDWLVARLVATAFLGEPQDGYTVNHKDGNRLNNNIDNLEWLSVGDNIRHGFDTGLYHNQNQVILTDGETTYQFRSMAEASRFLGRAHGYISGCRKNNRMATSEDGKVFAFVEEN